MAILNILHYPDERLHKTAKSVAQVDERIRKLVDDMAETMYQAPGIGLAATQVDVHLRVIVMDLSETHDQLQVLINPRIVEAEGQVDWEEGCLSVPGIYEKVCRADRIVVEALDRDGNLQSIPAEGLMAVCIQHEIDHLDGKVFVEKLSRLKQIRILGKLKKNQRKTF